MSNGSTRGTWPDPDVQVVADYKQEKHTTSTRTRTPKCVMRIHMDIDIDEADVGALMSDLHQDKGPEIYRRIIGTTNPKKRGPAVLRAAFRLKEDGTADPDPEP